MASSAKAIPGKHQGNGQVTQVSAAGVRPLPCSHSHQLQEGAVASTDCCFLGRRGQRGQGRAPQRNIGIARSEVELRLIRVSRKGS